MMTPELAVHIAAPGVYYRCECPKGMRLRANGYDCQDLNECEIRNGGCSMFCINTQGSAKYENTYCADTQCAHS